MNRRSLLKGLIFSPTTLLKTDPCQQCLDLPPRAFDIGQRVVLTYQCLDRLDVARYGKDIHYFGLVIGFGWNEHESLSSMNDQWHYLVKYDDHPVSEFVEESSLNLA